VLGVNLFMVLSTELSEHSEYDIDTAQTIVRVSIVVALGGMLAFITDRVECKKDGRRKRKLLFGLNLAVVVFTLFSQLPLATNWVSKGLNVPEESVLIIALVMHQLITWMLCVCVWSSKQMVISICVLCMVLLSTMETFVDVTVALLGKPLEWQRTLLVFEAMQDVFAVALLVAVTSSACFRRYCQCCESTTKDAEDECMEFPNPVRERDFDAEQPEQPQLEMDPPDPSGIDPGASDNAPTRSVMQLWRRRDQAAQEEQMRNDGRGAGLNPAAVDAMMQL
jgi:hypothetical protein